MADRKINVFVMGLDPFNHKLLKQVRGAENYEFHGLIESFKITHATSFDMEDLLDEARETLHEFDGPVDAIVSYWDFPSIAMLPILRREFGLIGPSLEGVLGCQHKYWSRRQQADVVPDIVPAFESVDPATAEAGAPPLDYPFWLKPVTAHSSKLGFLVKNADDYAAALEKTRARIHRFAEPLEVIMRYADLPDDIAEAGGAQCIAEGIISAGWQCTVEGYVHEGETTAYGIIDSVRGENKSSLERYEYPSALADNVKTRLRETTDTVLKRIGLDNTPFNIEFFYEEDKDVFWLLEINARISKSHSPIFEKVEGIPHKEVMVDVALGRKPDYPARQGRFRYAAKFMPRVYGCSDDEVVTRAPDEAELQKLEERYPGADINLHLEQGARLGDDDHTDEYSHELAAIFIGADSREDLHRKFEDLWEEMDVRVGPTEEEGRS